MVRIELGGRPIIDVNPAERGSAQRARRQLRGSITGSRSSTTSGFSWSNFQPRLVVTSDTDDFDHTIMKYFHEEGFQIAYLAYDGDKAAYNDALQRLAHPLEMGETYAIVAYGDAAALVLDACISPMPKLCGVVAYYPPYMPQTSTNFPPTLNVQIHLASSQRFGTRHPSFRYPNTEEGFAEHDLEEFDEVAATLAWSRTLGILRSAFNIQADLEEIWENHTRLEFAEKDAAKTMATMVANPYVNHVPTMTGGIGATDLKRFYKDFFIPGNPPDLKTRLLSRTVGTDRVVDEMLCTFTHTQEIPWMLPGVPPTDKKVEVVIVAVVCVRGGKLYHEHIHWDQATVLVQVGLLDPKLVPKTFTTTESGREKEVKRLPVCGNEAARKVVDKNNGKSNQLISDW